MSVEEQVAACTGFRAACSLRAPECSVAFMSTAMHTVSLVSY